MGAIASALVAVLYDGHSALSMTAFMALFSLLALVSYLLLARPAERGPDAANARRRVVPILDQSRRDATRSGTIRPSG
jgi:hypothetical protein